MKSKILSLFLIVLIVFSNVSYVLGNSVIDENKNMSSSVTNNLIQEDYTTVGTCSGASSLNIGSSYSGYFSSTSDIKWYKWYIPAAGDVITDLDVPASSDFDIELYTSCSEYNFIFGNKGTGVDESLSYSVSSPTYIYAKVMYYGGGYGSSNKFYIKSRFTPENNIDLAGHNILISPLYPYDYDSIDINYYTINNGPDNAGAFKVTLYLDGSLIQTCSYNGLDSAYYAYCTYPGISLSAGSHTIKMIVDSNNDVYESNEGNNIYTRTITVSESPKPDLIISSISSQGTLTEGKTGKLDLVIKNQGQVSAGSTYTAIYIDGNLDNIFSTESIAAGNSLTYTTTFPNDYSGSHTIRYDADYYDYIVESNENNNQLEKTFTWKSSCGDGICQSTENKWSCEQDCGAPCAANQCASNYWKTCFNTNTFCCSGDDTDSDPATCYGQYYCKNSVWRECDPSVHTECDSVDGYYCTYTNNQWKWRTPAKGQCDYCIKAPVGSSCDCNGECSSGVCTSGYCRPSKCPIPDGSSAECDCAFNSDCPASYPYCEDEYPYPIHNGYDACLAQEPKYCGDNICNNGETTSNCPNDCKVTSTGVNINVKDLSGKGILNAKVYVDGSYSGMTNAFGYFTTNVIPGYRTIKATCPDDSFCDDDRINIQGNDYINLVCSCDLSKQDSDGDGVSDTNENLIGLDSNNKNDNMSTLITKDMLSPSCIDVSAITSGLFSKSDVDNMMHKSSALSEDNFDNLFLSENLDKNSIYSTLGVDSTKTVSGNYVLMSTMSSAKEVRYVSSGANLVYYVTDETGVTSIFIISAKCTGQFVGLLFGAGNGLKDDLVGLYDLGKLVFTAIIHFDVVQKKLVSSNLPVVAKAIGDLISKRDEIFFDIAISIFERGSWVLDKYGVTKGTSDYRAFQMGFFNGFLSGYIAEQVVGLFIGVGEAITLLEKGAAVSGISLRVSKLLNAISDVFGSVTVKAMMDLPFWPVAQKWSDNTIEGLAIVTKNKQALWYTAKTNEEIKYLSMSINNFEDNLVTKVGKSTADDLTSVLAKSKLKLVDDAIIRWSETEKYGLALIMKRLGKDADVVIDRVAKDYGESSVRKASLIFGKVDNTEKFVIHSASDVDVLAKVSDEIDELGTYFSSDTINILMKNSEDILNAGKGVIAIKEKISLRDFMKLYGTSDRAKAHALNNLKIVGKFDDEFNKIDNFWIRYAPNGKGLFRGIRDIDVNKVAVPDIYFSSDIFPVRKNLNNRNYIAHLLGRYDASGTSFVSCTTSFNSAEHFATSGLDRYAYIALINPRSGMVIDGRATLDLMDGIPDHYLDKDYLQASELVNNELEKTFLEKISKEDLIGYVEIDTEKNIITVIKNSDSIYVGNPSDDLNILFPNFNADLKNEFSGYKVIYR